MLSIRSSLSFLLFITASIVSAVPTPATSDPGNCPSQSNSFDTSVELPPLTPEQILAIAPDSSCTNSKFPANECHNNVIAARRLNEGFQKYNLKTLGQQAALISYMAFESADFTANINHFPGRPGQGTKCMLMFSGIYKFSATYPDNIQTIKQNSPGGQVLSSVPFDQIDTLFTPQQQMNIRQTVLGEDRTFQSAMWLTTNDESCVEGQTAQGLSTDGEQGWRNWNKKCLFIGEGTPDREARWCQALKALAPKGMELPDICA